MNVFSGIIYAIILAPKLFKLIGAVMELMDDGVDWLNIQKRMDQLVPLLKETKATGDTSALEATFHSANQPDLK